MFLIRERLDQEMKKSHILGVTLFAMFAFAGSASAAETAQWLVDGATTVLAEAINVDGSTNSTGILLEDMNATLKPDILCTKVEGLGFVYANGEGEVVEGKCTASESMTSGVTCEAPVPVDLPWLTWLYQESSGEFLGLITSDGKGEPGFQVTCTALGIKVTDTCTGENLKSTQKNDGTTEEVEVTGLETVEKSEEASCTVGGKEEGLISGSGFLTALNAAGTELLGLTVSLASEVS